jgi:hypothetical protein
VFDCWSLEVWREGAGAPDAELAFARDIGLNRKRNYTTYSGFALPRWGNAVERYLPAVRAGNEAALRELVGVIEWSARGELPHVDGPSVLRTYRKWAAATDSETRATLIGEFLNLLKPTAPNAI